MTGWPLGSRSLTPEMLLRGYANGIFPMARSRDSAWVDWIDPRLRGVIPLDGFHISRSLRRRILRGGYEIRVNHDFVATVQACAAREETWINDQILQMYAALHRIGHAHSLEVWEDGQMTGGLYGVSLGAAFFGESMFSRRMDASKLALAWQMHRMRAGGFKLFDTQYLTPHLQTLGGVEITRKEYRERLDLAMTHKADFQPAGYCPRPEDIIRSDS